MPTDSPPVPDPAAWLSRAWADYAAGKLESALGTALQAMATEPPSPQGLAALAWFLLESGDLATAEATLAAALATFPATAVLKWYLGVLRFRQGRQESAVEALGDALRLDPSLDDAAETLAWALHDLGRHAEALPWAEQALALHDKPGRHLLLGRLCLKAERPLDAAVHLLEAGPGNAAAELLNAALRGIEADETQRRRVEAHAEEPALALEALFWLLRERGNAAAARQVADRLVAGFPQHVAGWLLAGVVANEAGDRGRAESLLTGALARDAGLVDARLHLAQLQLSTRRPEAALITLEPLLASAAPPPTACRIAAQIRIEQGQFDAARALLHPLLAADSGEWSTWHLLALALAQSGRRRAAFGALRRVLQQRADDPSLWQQAVAWALELGQPARAAWAIDGLARCRPDDDHLPEYRLWLARLLADNRCCEQAVEYAENVAGLAARHVGHWHALAACLRRAGRFDLADRAIQGAMRTGGHDIATRNPMVRLVINHQIDWQWSHFSAPVNAGSRAALLRHSDDEQDGATYDYGLCSLCTVSHLPLARTLIASVRKHFDGDFHLLLIDSDDPRLIPEGVRQVRRDDLVDSETWEDMLRRYNVLERCCALKALLVRHLVRHAGVPLFYLDADTFLLAPLEPALPRTADFSVFLTPHMLQPRDDPFRAFEASILGAGAFNAGVVGVGSDRDARRFADWWADRSLHFAYDAPETGVFTDQRWLDLAPSFFRKVRIGRNPGLNLGHWRVVSQFEFSEGDRGRLDFQGSPAILMHMSGFRVERRTHLARHLSQPVTHEPLARLLRTYADELVANGQTPA